MTTTPHSVLTRVADAAPPQMRATAAPSVIAPNVSDGIVWTLTVLAVLILFLLLENPYWVPGGDSEVYLAAARNLAGGNGYMFNGQAARIAPPGWPLVLAGMIEFVSSSFLALKLVTLFSMVAALAIYYRIVRRFVSPLAAAGVVLLTAVISHVYSLTFWLHSDALFTLITAAMLLLAIQINEGRRPGWRVALLLALCVAGAFVRWAGVLNATILVAALMQGRQSLRNWRAWATSVAVCAITAGAFFTIAWGVRRFAPERVPFEASAQVDATAVPLDPGAENTREAQMVGLAEMSSHSGYATRLIGFGTWLSYFLWQPFRLASGIRAVWWPAMLIGWVVIGVIVFAIWPHVRSMRWLLPGTFAYIFALCILWPQANARYLVPVAPLIVLMIVLGLRSLSAAARRPWQIRTSGVLSFLGLGSVIVCNLALWGIDLWVMRSSHFYDRYEAGVYKPLLAAAQYLSEHRAGNWQTCVNPEYINYNKRKMSPTGLRILTMLTGKAVLQLPKQYTTARYKLPNDREFRRNFVAKGHVRYYLEQPPVSPWRLQHFRVPWLQKLVTHQPPEIPPGGDGWRLYVCDGASSPIQVPLPDKITYPTRVPGF